MKRKFLCAIFIPMLLSGCGADKKGGPPGGPAGMPPPEVDVMTVVAGAATITQELPGRLQAFRTAQVRARVDGVVEKRLFVEGSDVKSGAALFRIDPRNYQSVYDSAQADLDVAKLTLSRYQPLLEMKAVSKQEVDLAAARVKQAEAVLIRAKLDLENTTVPAPISGRIGRAMVTEGALAGRAEASLLATIEQLDPIYVNFTQPGIDVLRIRNDLKQGRLKEAEGASVELVLEDGSLYSQQGKLLFSDLAVDPTTGSVSLRALFPNAEHDLLPGGFVRIRFPEAVAEGVLRVPQRSVMSGPQGQYVLLVDGEGKAVPRPVKTGGMSGGEFVIAEGLKGGEQVIVNGLQKVRPGTVVKPVTWNPKASLMPAAPTAPAAATAKKQG